MTPLPPDSLRSIQRPLYIQLAAMAIAAMGVGFVLGAPNWGISAGVGFLTAIVYYVLLAAQVRRTLGRGKLPHVLVLIISMLGRQVVCFLGPLACLYAFGQAWLACLVTLLIARHWVMVISLQGHGHAPTPTQA